MQSLLFLFVGLTLLVLLGIGAARGNARRSVPYALALGLVVGLVAAFAVLPVSVDVVPDDLEPGALALAILGVSAALALAGVQAIGRPRR